MANTRASKLQPAARLLGAVPNWYGTSEQPRASHAPVGHVICPRSRQPQERLAHRVGAHCTPRWCVNSLYDARRLFGHRQRGHLTTSTSTTAPFLHRGVHQPSPVLTEAARGNTLLNPGPRRSPTTTKELSRCSRRKASTKRAKYWRIRQREGEGAIEWTAPPCASTHICSTERTE